MQAFLVSKVIKLVYTDNNFYTEIVISTENSAFLNKLMIK
ncbi:hypothetical protein HMPREF0877_1637 [Weissella paramesenteroides ATCC 33313]|uniref:Uncharacterized protein n=1 Tax=Weissella paramesenteroides ATCC 33313 TaxID=585506 RepID=C5RCE1_WEIPA|nr:hypothetical protein HMPREF0877_1637 [Weissella paramesenteroides ATCC 33313]